MMRRVRFLNVFALVTIIALLTFGGYNIISSSSSARPGVGLVEIVCALLGALVLLYLRVSKNVDRAQTVTMLLTFFVMAFLLYTGGMEKTGIFWWFCFPAGAFYLKGRRGGWWWVGASLAVFLGFMLLETWGLAATPYSVVYLRQFAAAYLVVSLLMAAYETIRDDYEMLVERTTAETAAANTRLSQEVLERRRAEEAMYEAKQDADRANRAKSEFLSRMSHELRTPLNSILGFSQLLATDTDEPLTPNQRHGVEEILASGRHLLGLISELLDLARIEAGRIKLIIEPVTIGSLVRETVVSVRPLADGRTITMHVDLQDERTLAVHADTSRLRQVMLNLLSNAIKYNRDGGLVRVEARRSGNGAIQLSVTDTGYGIPPEKHALVFTPFERFRADDGGMGGTGIGLAITKHLVTLMGGTISFTSTESLGTCFIITLPEAPPSSALPAPPSKELANGTAAAGGTILYIEDDLANVALVRQILHRRPSLKLLHAGQGRLGLEMARAHLPDLLLLDIRLPDISGVEVLRRLQSDDLTSAIPVVVVTASAMPHEMEELEHARIVQCLTKPLDVPKFLKTIDALLTSSPSPAPDNAHDHT
ncbi:response regulator [Candidatus Fermentibacteria bacterium]|nr:response regulator [Candidatus Fermentibacteria bacterium]